MSISVPTGYGSIYCSTWWGDYKNIQRAMPYMPDCILPQRVQNYIDRVEADSGTVEGKLCVANALIDLGYDASDNRVDIIAQAYYTRVETDSGTLEGKTCLETKLKTLITT